MVRENLVTAYGVSTRHYSDNLPWAKIFSEDRGFTHYWKMTPQWKFCQFATVSTQKQHSLAMLTAALYCFSAPEHQKKTK